MPPEAFRKVVSIQTDVWACGVLLFELLAGRLPFYDDDMFALMDAIRAAPVPTLPAHVPAEVRAVVERALARKRTERYVTAASMREALTAAVRPKSLPVEGADLHAELTVTPAEARNGGTFIVGDGRWRINVPAGGADGHGYRYPDLGEPGRHGGRHGDLMLQLRVPPPPGPQLG